MGLPVPNGLGDSLALKQSDQIVNFRMLSSSVFQIVPAGVAFHG